jgi:hypothetical protein
MAENDNENVDSNFADLILILQSVWTDEDGDKFWDKNKDWLLDDNGTKVYL